MSQLDITRRYASPRLEEEDLPVDSDLSLSSGATDLTTDEDYAPPPPTAQAPAPQAPAEEPSDLLQRYFSSQGKMQDRLASAERTSEQNKFLARLGGAFNTLAQSSSTRPVDNAAFEGMAKDATAPVDRIERQQKLEQGGDKMLLNYFLNKSRVNSLDAWRNGQLEERKRGTDLRGKGLDERARHNREIEGAVKSGIGIREKGLEERVRHNQTSEGIAEKNVGMRREGLDQKAGTQAAQAADKFTKDSVIKTASTQLSQIDKAVGRLRDVAAGKIPFSTTLKAEIEKDIANVISGGSNSSLGQLHRVEFEPYIARWQAALDKINGYQGNIDAPEFRAQVLEQLTGLAADLKAIRAKRSKDIEGAYGTAYSKNGLATKTIQDNVKMYGDAGEAPKAPPAANEVARKTKDGRTAIFDAKTKQFIRYQE